MRGQKLMKKKPHNSLYLLSKTLSEVRLKANALIIGAHIDAVSDGSLVITFLGI